MKQFTSCLLLFLTSQVFGQLGFSLANGATKVQIPIEVHNNLVVIPVIINNQLPLKFIVDTGVRTSILTDKAYSDVLHMAYSKKFTIAGPGLNNSVNAYVANNVTIDMPGVHGKGHAMLVLETDYLELKNSLGTAVQGILGYELFSRFVVKIDYNSRLLTLISPSKFKAPRRKYTRIPITVEDTKPYYVAEIKLNDTTSISAKLMVDSGASHGIFLDAESNKRIVIPKNNIECIVGRGLGGIITGRIGRIASLKIGKYHIPDMIASFPDPGNYMDTIRAGAKVYRNGSIGGDVLSRFDVIFDFPHEKIYLKPNSSFRKKSFNNMSGLTIKAEGLRLNEFEVVEVRANSAGDKEGILSGDKIISINNIPTSDLNLSQINNFFSTKPGRKIKLQLIRNNMLIKKEFQLINEI